jgi:hypothetical protein
MQDRKLLQLALVLNAPWIVNDVNLDLDDKKLDISIDFERGGRFGCPQCLGGVALGPADAGVAAGQGTRRSS